MLQDFHFPNPNHRGTPLEGTFDPCNIKAHAEAFPELHQQIDVAGERALIRLDCEHKSHAVFVHELSPLELLGNDLRQQACDKCGKRMKASLLKGTMPEVVKANFIG